MLYFSLAIAPIIIILIAIYFSDSYNKEPFRLLMVALLIGMAITIPIIIVERVLSMFEPLFNGMILTFYKSFIEAGFVEEFFKYIAVIALIWKNHNFDEKYDGIVYAVFISLGFALVENIIYVFGYGLETGFIRIFTAVPAHAIFGISMGFYIGLAKFKPSKRINLLILGFITPWLLHGFYDFIIFSGHSNFLIVFILYLVFLYVLGFNRIIKIYKTKKYHQIPVLNYTSSSNYRANNNSSYYNQGQNTNYNKYNESSKDPNNHNYNAKTKNLEILSILHYIYAGMHFISALMILGIACLSLIFGSFFPKISLETETIIASKLLFGIGIIYFILITGYAVLEFLCGKFISKKQNRIFCIVMSVIKSFYFPLGTALGIYTIIEINKEEVKKQFNK